MMNRDDNGFVLIFVQLVFKFGEKIFAGFDIAFFVDAGIFVPVCQKPFGINENQGDVFSDFLESIPQPFFGRKAFLSLSFSMM